MRYAIINKKIKKFSKVIIIYIMFNSLRLKWKITLMIVAYMTEISNF